MSMPHEANVFASNSQFPSIPVYEAHDSEPISLYKPSLSPSLCTYSATPAIPSGNRVAFAICSFVFGSRENVFQQSSLKEGQVR